MLKRLLVESPADIRYKVIVIVPAHPKKISRRSYIINQIRVFGLWQVAKIATLYIQRSILNSMPNKDCCSVEKMANKYKMSIIRTDSLNSDDLIGELKKSSIDLVLSIASSRIFKQTILSLPPKGCINVHAGKLPKYRGVNPSFWTLLNKETMSAITVHYMNENIDDGDIIQQDVFDIRQITTLHQMYLKILELAPLTVIKALESIRNDTVHTIRNDSSLATYYSFPTKSDGRRFRSLGFKLI